MIEPIFADAFYWVALANPADDFHRQAFQFVQQNRNLIVTSEEVLTEFLNYNSKNGVYRRKQVVEMVDDIYGDPQIHVNQQTSQTFRKGFELYRSREDKGYSLTDCISMITMREEGINKVLTHDIHFKQEGFTVLFS
jgi:predicted nucleic acid-binding protein